MGNTINLPLFFLAAGSRGGRRTPQMLISPTIRRKLDAHCRTYVIGNGKQTGFEFLTGYCCYTGKMLGRTIDRRVDAVSVPRKFAVRLKDKRGRFVLHHNHPNGSSLSREDLLNLTRLPGTMLKYAHGHAKQFYAAENLKRRDLESLLLACDLPSCDVFYKISTYPISSAE